MQFSITLAMALSLIGAVIAAPQVSVSRGIRPKPRPRPRPTIIVTVPSTAPCVTQYTVTTSYPPADEPYTTTSYKVMAAIPRDLICKSCSLEIVTETINESRTPDATVTAESTLIRVPMCYDPPQATPAAEEN
ncbi:hypothetical protein TWF281_004195 [Arthrobotrys megalospora]